MTGFITTLLRNHVLANLTFALVMIIGLLSYSSLPRQQDPTINFNWIVITTILPGASAMDVEKKVTDPLEDALRTLSDVKFMSSNSRPSISSILIRFEDLDNRTFDKRVADLRREIQNTDSELPDEAEDPLVLEITSANAYPSATVAVVGQTYDETLRVQAKNVEKSLERLNGVDRVDPTGLSDPEIRVSFKPHKLEDYGLSPGQVADTVNAFFQDIAAGDIDLDGKSWQVRLIGSDADPVELAHRPIIGSKGEVLLHQVAAIERSRAKAGRLTRYEGKPAVLLAVMKQSNANTIDLVERVTDYVDERNQLATRTGVELVLIDDQTTMTRNAIQLMENNALIGLLLVLLVAWVFLGTRIAVLTAIGIPFILAGTFWILSAVGETLNVMVLLGVVIVLGMLVDDAVVVVEGIHYRIQRGAKALDASLRALKEVAAPVSAAVFTTVAAFGPLILLPGILGDFMRVVPMVVIIALLLSLVESFWMLPAHVIAANVHFEKPNYIERLRQRFTHWIRVNYVRLLIKCLRYRWLTLLLIFVIFGGAVFSLGSGKIKVDFFAADTIRLFYVNIEMPSDSSLENTMNKVLEIETKVKQHIREGEARAVIAYSGSMFTETEPRLGDHLGQIMVGLNPRTEGLRTVEEMIESMREEILKTPGAARISFLRLAGGPPTSKPINVKVLGDDYDEIRQAANDVRDILGAMEGVIDIEDDASRGRNELILRLDNDAIRRNNLNPLEINRTLQLMIDGLVVADMRDAGEKVEVRVKAKHEDLDDIGELLNFRLQTPDGDSVALYELVSEERKNGLGNIRHYNFRRAITVEADIEKGGMDTKTANDLLKQGWEEKAADKYPDIALDFTGQLDDINESLDSIVILFIFGVGVMYSILGTQFRSYFQPLLILSTLFMAFTGVTYGLLASQNPLSLYTLYGIVALSGIAVNAAIVLISAGNARIKAGMSVLHATLYAARRRVVPILITSLTTIAGLISLATGLGGESLIWGPVATAIVWGLAFSTILTLIVIPLLYRLFMPRSYLLAESKHH